MMRYLKRSIMIVGGIVAAAAAALAALPGWLPWVAPAILGRCHVHYAAFQRTGYGHFLLRDARYEHRDVVFTAKQIQAMTPSLWLWRKWFGGARSQEEFLTVRGWQCEILTTNRPPGPQSTAARLPPPQSTLEKVRDWVPKAALHDGMIRIAGNDFAVPSAVWERGGLRADFSWAPRRQIAAGGAYANLTGTLNGQWAKGKFRLDLTARAQPLVSTNRLSPPMDLQVAATGDTNSVRIETAHLSSPGLTARLSPGLEMTYEGRMLSPEATFEVQADAAQQPWVRAAGQLEGTVDFRRQLNTFPDLFFRLSSQNLEGFGLQTAAVNLEGHLSWPALRVDRLRVQFANRSSAEAAGSVDLQTGVLHQATLHLAGLVSQYFLPGLACDHLALDAQFNGPWNRPKHSGQIDISGLAAPPFAPVGIAASWSGQSLNLDRWRLTVTAPEKATLSLNGSASLAPANAEITLIDFSLENGGRRFALQTPARIVLQPGAAAGKGLREGTDFLAALKNCHLLAEPLRWRGGTTELMVAGRLQWPQMGDLSCSARDFSFEPFQPFFKRPLPAADIARLEGTAHWSNGPASFSVELLGTFRFPPSLTNLYQLPFTVQTEATGDARGLAVSRLSVAAHNEGVLSAAGSLPLVLKPADEEGFFHLDSKGPLDLRAGIRPSGAFWNQLTRRTPLQLNGPSVDLQLGGTLEHPQGTMRLAVNSIDAALSRPWPALHASGLAAVLAFSPSQIELQEFRGLIEGQPLTATAQFPLPDDFMHNWRKALDWRKISGQARAEGMQMAAFVKFAPDLLAAQGTLDVAVSASHGQLSGQLRLTNAASQPLPDLGAIQDVAATITFEGSQARLQQATGLVGGGAVVVSGKMDLARREPDTGLPYFDAQASSQSLPLARSAALILRSGFQIKISNATGGPPLISGQVQLQNSYYLSDLRLLAPGPSAGPASRPPYFSFDVEPFSDWRLDLEVAGHQFMNVRSPFFAGVASASFHLGGTLANPTALGEVKINSGEISFPFASLAISQGEVFLTSADPSMPHLFISASARAYGYDLRMQVSGSADHPLIDFSSSSGLTSDQILAMLTTGGLPVNAGAFTPEQRAGRIGLFVGKNVLTQYGLFPGGEERLTVGSGEGFGELTFPEEVLQTYSAEYKMTKHWSLIGEYDPFGVNLGLKWRFYSK